MSFESATVTQRCAVLDAASKVATLVRQLTHGSGQVPSELTATADSLLSDLASALSAIGISDLTDTEAVVDNADTVTVKNFSGADSASATAVVADSALSQVTLPASAALVFNSDTCSVRSSTGATEYVTDGVCALNTSTGVLSSVRLPATSVVISNDSTSNVAPTGTYTSTVTFTVAGDAITAITLS